MNSFKNLLPLLLLLLSVGLVAQQPIQSQKQLAQSRQSSFNQDMQTTVKEVVKQRLYLEDDEASAFTGLYNRYVQDYIEIQQKQDKLIEELAEEFSEDDNVKDKQGDLADFIENYWESQIAIEELKKDYFDKMEDVVGPMRALEFFRIQKMYESRQARGSMMRVPVMVTLTPVQLSYQSSVDDYTNWKQINIDGKVGLDHNFTYNGLEKLLTTAEDIATTEGIRVKNFSSRKAQIMQLAQDMKTNWKDTSHANSAKKAFTMTSELLRDLNNAAGFGTANANLNQLMQHAQSLNTNTLYTEQSDTVYAFFNSAERVVNGMIGSLNEKSMQSYGKNYGYDTNTSTSNQRSTYDLDTERNKKKMKGARTPGNPRQ